MAFPFGSRTKAEGEGRVRSVCPRSIILRTAWLYGKHGPNFVYTMLRLMKEREKIGVVCDQQGSPTWAADLASAILSILTSPQPHPYGTYHYTNSGTCTWHAFAQEIHRLGLGSGLLERPCEVSPLSTSQYPTKAQRPAYSVLSKEKILADYGVAIPDWKESLAKFIAGLA
jgi:dTDP-4-dehydrorhamnose reductase